MYAEEEALMLSSGITCGIETEGRSDFERQSTAEDARGEEDAPRAELALSMGMTQRALVEGRWKLIRYPRIDHAQLFDLASDPHELVDQSGRPEMADRVKDMSAHLAALMSQAGDDAPLSVDEPQPFTRDLSEVKRNPDRWQPRWIREKYFGSR